MPRAFSLDGTGDERYVLLLCPDRWKVFYSERGLQSEARDFSSESEALEHLYKWLKDDPSTRIRPEGSSH